MHVFFDLSDPNSQLGEAFMLLDRVEKDDCSYSLIVGLDD